ncbi:MAG TPA: hypothetical protein VH482_21890 [Thermomicrobiales bacterium]|jgi:hypothetical protein
MINRGLRTFLLFVCLGAALALAVFGGTRTGFASYSVGTMEKPKPPLSRPRMDCSSTREWLHYYVNMDSYWWEQGDYDIAQDYNDAADKMYQRGLDLGCW